MCCSDFTVPMKKRKVVFYSQSFLFTFQVKLRTHGPFHSSPPLTTGAHNKILFKCGKSKHYKISVIILKKIFHSGHSFKWSMKRKHILMCKGLSWIKYMWNLAARIHFKIFIHTHTHTHTLTQVQLVQLVPAEIACINTIFSSRTHKPKSRHDVLKGSIFKYETNTSNHMDAHTYVQQTHRHTEIPAVLRGSDWFLLIRFWGSKVSHGSAYEAAFAAAVSRWHSACTWCDDLIWMGCRTLWREEKTWGKKISYQKTAALSYVKPNFIK